MADDRLVILNIILWCIYTTYPTRSIFKRSTAGLNSSFSFFYIGCLTKAKEPSLSYYLPIAREDNGWILAFLTQNANSFMEDLNSDHRFYFSKTLRTPLNILLKLATVVEGAPPPQAPFLISTRRFRRGHYSLHWITSLTLGPCLIMQSVRQGSMMCHFLVWLDLGLNPMGW